MGISAQPSYDSISRLGHALLKDSSPQEYVPIGFYPSLQQTYQVIADHPHELAWCSLLVLLYFIIYL
jgi:hypothetical protein